jgi:hypothetical protein
MPKDWIIAHRCVDLNAQLGTMTVSAIIDGGKAQENTLESMTARFQDGFGIETDLRGDCRSETAGILISHDLPLHGKDYPTLAAVFDLYVKVNTNGCLALNIKDAGLQARLKPILDRYGIKNYFTFDGANPDVLVDSRVGITAFGRESEIEPFNAAHKDHPLSNYPTIAGLWLDNFSPTPWITQDIVARHFKAGKDVAIVSPELHPWARADQGETFTRYWTQYCEALRALRKTYPDRRMMICTKFPTFAARFFND